MTPSSPPSRTRQRASLAVPHPEALGAPAGGATPDESRPLRRSGGPAETASRRVLRGFGAVVGIAGLAAAIVPISRTVTLDGQLVPERTVVVRAAEPGLLDAILITAGDTVLPGALVARLRSPTLDEAFRTADPSRAPWTLLARRARLDVHAPPFAERLPDGTADPASLFRGGIVLTEGLAGRHGARLDAGDTVVELAALATDGRAGVPLVVRAWADERAALRVRPGMPARLTFPAIPQERPRQTRGLVARVGLAPDPGAGSHATSPAASPVRWRVEVAVAPDQLDALLHPAYEALATQLRTGVAVEVVVEERTETLFHTARQFWTSRSALPLASRMADGRP